MAFLASIAAGFFIFQQDKEIVIENNQSYENTMSGGLTSENTDAETKLLTPGVNGKTPGVKSVSKNLLLSLIIYCI